MIEGWDWIELFFIHIMFSGPKFLNFVDFGAKDWWVGSACKETSLYFFAENVSLDIVRLIKEFDLLWHVSKHLLCNLRGCGF